MISRGEDVKLLIMEHDTPSTDLARRVRPERVCRLFKALSIHLPVLLGSAPSMAEIELVGVGRSFEDIGLFSLLILAPTITFKIRREQQCFDFFRRI